MRRYGGDVSAVGRIVSCPALLKLRKALLTREVFPPPSDKGSRLTVAIKLGGTFAGYPTRVPLYNFYWRWVGNLTGCLHC